MFINLRRMVFCAGLVALGMSVFVWVPATVAQEKSDRKLVKKVQPTYPPLAGRMHLSGAVKVVLQVTPEGKVASVHTVGGSPILASAVEDAVKQWKYEAAAKQSSEEVTIAFEAPK